MAMNFSHDMPFGAQVRDDGVRFRLWAPAQDEIRLVVESVQGEHLLPMTRQNDGWFELVTDAAASGDRYRYVLDDGMRVPDPASRFQPDDVHAASEVIDPGAYPWQRPEWRGRPWREAVIYEAHVGAFSAAGDYDGACRKLDHLADLGVTALELMPLSDFEGRRNWGYDGVQPFAPDSSYGRPEALKRLIDAAHARGLMMFLDVVYNHFGPSGNYLGLYAPQFFTDRYHTPWGQAIDFSRGEVRQFFIHNALYWLEEYRFDGLRLDAVDQIRDASQPHVLAEIAEAVRTRFPDRHIHLVLENDDNAAHYLTRESSAPPLYTAQWNDDFHHAAHVLATDEDNGYYVDYTQQPAAALARALAQGFIYQGEHSGYRDHKRGQPSASLPPLAFVDFLQNHDQIGNRAFGERLAQLADADAVETLTAIWLLAPSIPLFFMGQEWAAKQPFLYFCDYQGELADAVREGRRREFGKFAAFADPAARERIPDPNDESTFAASVLDWNDAATPEGKRHLDFVRELLDIRRREIEPRLSEDLQGGRYVLAGEHALHVQWTLAGGARLHLAANPGDTPASGLDWTLPGKRLYARPHDLQAGTVTQLPPWSILWSRM